MDVGGSGIKGCLVDLEIGQLIGERVRIETPQPSLPDLVYGVVAEIVDAFHWTGRIGVTFPGVMKSGVTHTAANVDKSWIGTDVDAGLEALIPGAVHTLNDADAAGLAEMRYGAGRDQSGVVLMLTFGTGIGSALFVDGHLVPNTEFGHIQVDGEDGERRASAAVREREDLDYPTWAQRVDRYLDVLEAVVPGRVHTLNDADAAGLAEMRYGAGRDRNGVVLMLTFGTGIGSALFTDGTLVPNTEFGHIQVDGHDGEKRASAAARDREELSYPDWAERVDRYLDVLEAGVWPDLIIVGGGVSKKAHKWVPLLSTRTPVVPAQLQNDAGIVGAALAAVEQDET